VKFPGCRYFFARNPPCAILKGCSADLGTACLDLSRLISSHIILFILPAEHYSFYQPNSLLLFLPMALRLFPAVQSHLNSSVYLPTTAGRTGLCSHLSLNWLMLLAWWGCCSGWVQASSSNLYERGNCSRCIHFVPLCSPLFSPFLFFFDSCRGKQLYGSVLGH